MTRFKDKTTKQKRHTLFMITESNKYKFWLVCGKSRQKYYQNVRIDDDNINVIANDLYKEYKKKLKHFKAPLISKWKIMFDLWKKIKF